MRSPATLLTTHSSNFTHAPTHPPTHPTKADRGVLENRPNEWLKNHFDRAGGKKTGDLSLVQFVKMNLNILFERTRHHSPPTSSSSTSSHKAAVQHFGGAAREARWAHVDIEHALPPALPKPTAPSSHWGQISGRFAGGRSSLASDGRSSVRSSYRSSSANFRDSIPAAPDGPYRASMAGSYDQDYDYDYDYDETYSQRDSFDESEDFAAVNPMRPVKHTMGLPAHLPSQPLGHDRRVTLGPDYGLATLFGRGGGGGVSENSHPAQSQSRRVTLGPDYGLAGLFAEQPSPVTARQAAAAVAAEASVEAMSARMLDDDARRLFILSRASIGNSPSSSGGAERSSQVEVESRRDSLGSADHSISTLRAPTGRGSLSMPVPAAASSPASAGPRRLSVSGAPAAAHRRDTIPAQWLSPPPPRRGEAQDEDQDEDPPTPAPRRPVLSIRLSSVRHDQSHPSRPRPQQQHPPPPPPPRGLRPLHFTRRDQVHEDQDD